MPPSNHNKGPGRAYSALRKHQRTVGVVLVLVGLLIVGNWVGSWLSDQLQLDLTPRTEPTIHRMIMWSVAAYAVLIAIPFVPGLEIAVAILLVAGPGIVALLYAVTVFGLSVSFLVGYWVPLSWLRTGLLRLGLARMSDLVASIDGLGRDAKLEHLVARAPNRFVPLILKHRYLAVALLLNIPGNMAIGGGGGICLLAGLTKLYAPHRFVLMLTIAVAPLPLAIAIFGHGFMAN